MCSSDLEVIGALAELKDEDGTGPLEKIIKWESAGDIGLPPSRSGDLVLANRATYNWIEEVTEDLQIFKDSLKGGYKQAVIARDEPGMWTPFIIMGPRIRPGFALPKPIEHMDQYPTIMKALGEEIPSFVEGKPLNQIFLEEKTGFRKQPEK